MPLTEAEWSLLGQVIRQELDTPRNRYVGTTVQTRNLMESIEEAIRVAEPGPAPVATRRGPLSRDEERAIERVLRAQFEAGIEGRPQDMTTIPGLVQRIQEELARVPQLFSSRTGLVAGELSPVAAMTSGRQSGMSMGAAAAAASMLLRAGERPQPILNPSPGPGGSPAGTRPATAQEAEDSGSSRVPMMPGGSLWSRDLVVSRLAPAPPTTFTPPNVALTPEQRERVARDARALMGSGSVNVELERSLRESTPVAVREALQAGEDQGTNLLDGMARIWSVGTPRRQPSPTMSAVFGSPERSPVQVAIDAVMGSLVGGARTPGSTQEGMFDREYEHMTRLIRDGLGVTEEMMNRYGTTAAPQPPMVALDTETEGLLNSLLPETDLVPSDPVMRNSLLDLWNESATTPALREGVTWPMLQDALRDAVGIQPGELIQSSADSSAGDLDARVRRWHEVVWGARARGDGSAPLPMASGGGGSIPVHLGSNVSSGGDLAMSGSGPVVRPIVAGEVVFQTSGGVETLRISQSGELYFRGRKVDSDPEVGRAFRLFLCQAGALHDPELMGEDLDSRGILSRFDRKDPVG